MDVGNVGYGAGGGVLTAILTYIGFKQRLDRADADMSELKKAVVYKDTCGVCHAATLRACDVMDKKLDKILDKMK